MTIAAVRERIDEVQMTLLDNRLTADRPLLFGEEGTGVTLGRGWHPAESDFAWTDGPFAELSFAVDRDIGSYLLAIDCAPLMMAGAGPAQVLVFVNGRLCAAEVLDDRRVIEAAVADAAPIANLVFWVPDARSPHEIDPAFDDVRRLGIRVRSVALIAVGAATVALATAEDAVPS